MGDSSSHNPAGGSHPAELALLDYLDSLLHDSDEPAATDAPVATVMPLAALRAARPARVIEPLPLESFADSRPFAEPVRPLRMPLPPVAVPAAETIAVPAAAPVAPAPVELRIPQPPAPPAVVEPPPAIVNVETEAETATPVPPAWAPNGRPQWAQQPFECLLFKSGGLTLAVPLVELGSIYPLEEGDITPIFGQIGWFLGLMQTKYGSVRVVDSARVVMPERYDATMADAYRYVLTLNESDWGLTLDSIAGTDLLDPEAVKWRSDRSKRPWLAGTVVDKMCALLDVAQMRFMFDRMDRKRDGR